MTPDPAANAAAVAALTHLLIVRGCPIHLLDEAWSVLVTQEVETTPGRLITQIDTAIARAKD